MFDLKSFFRQKNALVILLYINVGVFAVTKFAALVMTLFRLPTGVVTEFLMLPASTEMLLYRPWTLLTYMFLHVDFMHLFFNMLCLLWFGKIFLEYLTQRQLVGLYLLGGVGAGLIYVAAYNLFPYFAEQVVFSRLLGASGSLMAIVLATAMYVPNYEINLFLIGRVKLKWMACAMVLFCVFGITSSNAGGEFAHIGGAVVGALYVWLLRRGRDLAQPFNRAIDAIVNAFKRKPKIKVSKHNYRPKTDAEYNSERARNMRELDAILDKVKASGYSSLSDDEKRRLFDRSQNL